jgi:hypothetical protein
MHPVIDEGHLSIQLPNPLLKFDEPFFEAIFGFLHLSFQCGLLIVEKSHSFKPILVWLGENGCHSARQRFRLFLGGDLFAPKRLQARVHFLQFLEDSTEVCRRTITLSMVASAAIA